MVKIGLMAGTGFGLLGGWAFRSLIALTYKKFFQITRTKPSAF